MKKMGQIDKWDHMKFKECHLEIIDGAHDHHGAWQQAGRQGAGGVAESSHPDPQAEFRERSRDTRNCVGF